MNVNPKFYQLDDEQIFEAQYPDKAISVLFPLKIKDSLQRERIAEIVVAKVLPSPDSFTRVEISELEFKSKLAEALNLINT